ncbi:unnamed protein product [Victoria cruziana]
MENPLVGKMEKRLDFNAPLLSVRRFTAAAAAASSASSKGDEGRRKWSRQLAPAAVKELSPPVYESDLISEPVRNPGAVPFVWESAPGKPKNGTLAGPVLRPSSDGKLQEQPPAAPRPPPGRMVDGVKEREETVGDDDRETCKVGRLQSDDVVESVSSEREVIARMDDLAQNSGDRACVSSCLEEGKIKDNFEEEQNDDDAYSDGLDRLSVAELSLFNCSISDLSALDGQGLERAENSELQRLSFIMERFLPAAKAMAIETPKYAPRKHLASEPVRQVFKFRREEEPSPYQNKLSLMPQLAVEADDVEADEEDVRDEDDKDPGDLMAQSCGFDPWSFRISLCLTNSLVHERRERSKNFASRKRSTSIDSGSYCGSDELTWEAVYRNKLIRNVLALGVHDGGRKLSESNSSPSAYLDTTNNWSDSQTQDEILSFRHSAGGISPQRNKASSSPLCEGSEFLGTPKSRKSYSSGSSELNIRGLEIRSNSSQCRGKGTSMSPEIEKTVYVDSDGSMGMRDAKFNHAELTDVNHMMDKEPDTWVKERQKQVKLLPESYTGIADVDLGMADEKELRNSGSAKPIEAGLLPGTGQLSSSYASHWSGSEHGALMHEDCSVLKQSRSSTPPMEMINGGASDLDADFRKQQRTGNNTLEADTEGNSSFSHPLLPPPLPKSPSESWLLRALPSVPTKNPSSMSFIQSRRKWETIIKSTKVYHGHLPFLRN